MTRRSSACFLRLALAVGAAGLYWSGEVLSRPAGGLRPVSVQTHLHGIMSEGLGSMRGANYNARKLGIDVLWWSDHANRIRYFTYAKGYDFEAGGLSHQTTVPYPPGVTQARLLTKPMTIALTPRADNGLVVHPIARITAERAFSGEKSFDVSAAANVGKIAGGGPDSPFQRYYFTLRASGRRFKRALLSAVLVNISIFPELGEGDDAMAGIRFDLSEQPPGLQQVSLCYVLTRLGDDELAKLDTPRLKHIRLDYRPGQWNTYTLNLTGDAAKAGLGGWDNSLDSTSLGVATRGSRGRAFFDGFRIVHQYEGDELRDKAREVAPALEKEFGVVNYIGQEISLTNPHMNALGDEVVPMIDYARHPEGLQGIALTDYIHANGGIATLNHMFGTSRLPAGADPNKPKTVRRFEDRTIRQLIDTRCFHADVLEVGYVYNVLRLPSFLRAWDEISKAGVYITGNGTSDSHYNNERWFEGSNFVSWVWARSKSKAGLIDGLLRGDVYFGDPVRFQGELELTTADGHRMGQAVLTDRPRHEARLRIRGLPEGARVYPVVNGVRGGAIPGTTDFDHVLSVDTSQDTFVRAEAYLADGRPVVFSNPIYFTRSEAGLGTSPHKRALCQAEGR